MGLTDPGVSWRKLIDSGKGERSKIGSKGLKGSGWGSATGLGLLQIGFTSGCGSTMSDDVAPLLLPLLFDPCASSCTVHCSIYVSIT